jgi:chemotaxis protein MotB
MSRKRHPEHVNHERWLVSYADFITLLFAFFVVLFASSQADKKKQQLLGSAIQTAFSQMGIFETHSPTPPIDPNGASGMAAAVTALANSSTSVASGKDAALGEQLRAVHQAIVRMLAEQMKNGSIEVHDTDDGMVISLKETGFFESGSAEVRPATLPIVARIAGSLAPTPFAVRIEGHTDNVPIHTAHFDSNWELSTARASAVARVFLAQARMNPACLSAAGYAEFHPIANNATESGRAQNRRVDIIVLPRPAPSQSPASASDHQTPRRTPSATAPDPAAHS